jgi:uncharacterized protein YkwD
MWMTAARITPHVSAARLASVALAAVLLFSACFGGGEQQVGMDYLNYDRVSHGAPATSLHGMLQVKAQAWAERLANENTLYHSRLADGITGCWRSLGENVGYGGSIAEIQSAYMASPGHRANIMNASFNSAAVGVAHRGNRVFTVQVFMQAC